MRERDSQRSKVYAAEREAFGEVSASPSSWAGHPDYMTIEECQAYVDKVLASKWLIRKYGKRRIRVVPGRGGGWANPMTAKISLGRWARREHIILHEVAHILTPRTVAWHGWEFTSTYLDLVRHFLGQETHDRLKAAYRKHRVRIRPKVKRNLTPEQRAAAAERLAVARAAKAARKI